MPFYGKLLFKKIQEAKYSKDSSDKPWELISKMLEVDPDTRLSAEECLLDKWFD
jgi:serine/threonine protein kinase